VLIATAVDMVTQCKSNWLYKQLSGASYGLQTFVEEVSLLSTDIIHSIRYKKKQASLRGFVASLRGLYVPICPMLAHLRSTG
jgi:hypothetical protein